MTNKDKFFVGFLILLIVIQLGVIGSLLYSKYSNLILKEKEQTKQEEPIKEEEVNFDTLLETINNSEYWVKMQKITTNENNETVNEDKDVDKNTLTEVIEKLKENTNIEELSDNINLESSPYIYIVTYKIDEKENIFKILVTNDQNKAAVFIDNQYKLYNFNDNINDFMKNIYEK